jgi:hypothetical protein
MSTLDIDMITVFPGVVAIDRQQARAALENKNFRRRCRHHRPLLEIVRDFACSLLLVFQGQHEHPVPKGTPWIVILGDDTFAACGPEAFHGPSLDALITASDQAVLIMSGPEQLAYNVAATHAARDRRNVILIETLPSQQQAWEDRIRLIRHDDLPMFRCLPVPEDVPA